MTRFFLLMLAALSSWACSQPCHQVGLCVDCQAVCKRMVDCKVSFASESSVLGGENEQTRCERGCMTSDTITPARERCIVDVDTSNTDRCQKQVLGCLGADAGSIYAR